MIVSDIVHSARTQWARPRFLASFSSRRDLCALPILSGDGRNSQGACRSASAVRRDPSPAGFREMFEGAAQSGALFYDGLQKAMTLRGRQVVIVAKDFGRSADRGDAGAPVMFHFGKALLALAQRFHTVTDAARLSAQSTLYGQI
jgi:hypothetical protein